MIKDAKDRECFYGVESREDVRKELSIGLQNDYHSPAKDPRFNRNVASASGGDDASTNSNDRPIHQEKTSVNVPSITSTSAVESVARNQTPQMVTTEKDSVCVQIGGDTSDREKFVRTKSTDNELQNSLSGDGQGNRKATAYAKTTVHPAHLDERVNRGKDGVYQTNHHRGRESGISRHRHHQKKTEMRDSTNERFHSGRGLNDRHHGNRHSSKRPQDSASSSNRHGRDTDVSRERHRHHSSNREHHNAGQPNKDRTHENRHQGRVDVSEESAKRRKLQHRDVSHSAAITTPTSLGNNTGKREVESPSDRSHSPAPATSLWKSAAPASEVFNGEEVDCGCTPYMDTRESSLADSNHSSSTTTSLHGNLDSYGDHMDDDDSHMDTQDPAFAAVLANNHSYAPGYFLQLRELTKKSTGSSPIETFASTGSPKSPTETVPDNTLPRRNSTATSQSTSRQPLARSWPSGILAPHSASPTGVVRNTSTGSSSFCGQTLGFSSSPNTARSSNQQTSLADSHSSVSHAPHSAPPTGVVRNTSTGSSSFSGPSLGLSSFLNTARSSNQHTSLALRAPHSASLTGVVHNTSTNSSSFSAQSLRPRRNSTATSQSTSRQPLARSWPSGILAPHSASPTGVVRNTSTGSSSSSGQSMGLSSSHNTARSSNQHTSLADSHSSVLRAPHSASLTGVVRNTSTGSSSSSGQSMGLSSSHNTARSSNQQTSFAGSHSLVSHAPHSTSPTNVVHNTSTNSSSFSAQSLRPSGYRNTAASSNQHASLTGSHSSLGHRRSTILGDIVSDAQEAANVVRQRHPPVQGPQIIDAGALFRGRQRTAHAASRDVSSLRERAVGERVERTERTGRSRPRIDKRKFSENFRGRKSWE